MNPQTSPHQEYSELFHLYLDHELEEGQARELEDHLQQCPSCRQDFTLLQRMMEVMQGLEPIEAPPDFVANVRKRIKRRVRARRLPPTQSPLGFRIPYEILAVLMLAIMMALYWLLAQSPGPVSKPARLLETTPASRPASTPTSRPGSPPAGTPQDQPPPSSAPPPSSKTPSPPLRPQTADPPQRTPSPQPPLPSSAPPPSSKTPSPPLRPHQTSPSHHSSLPARPALPSRSTPSPRPLPHRRP